MSAEIPAPFVGLQTEIKPEWIDFNGHFNAGYYMVVFDDAVGPWMDFVGLDPGPTLDLLDHRIAVDDAARE